MFSSQSLNLFASPFIIMNLIEVFLLILKKTLDTVNYAIILTKLNHYGIRGNVHEWIKSHLSYREQFVIVSGHDSISLALTYGVPQGSIL